MWFDQQGVAHVEMIDDTVSVFSQDLRERLRNLPRRDFDAAILATEGYLRNLVEEVDSSRTLQWNKDDFVGKRLPIGICITNQIEQSNIAELISDQLDSAPSRWQLDLVVAAVDALYELRPGRWRSLFRNLGVGR